MTVEIAPEIMALDSRQVTRLWALAQPTISAYLTSIIRDPHARDDILQNVAVSITESFSNYDAERSFVAWAMGVAQNEIRQYLKRERRNLVIFDTETVERIHAAFLADEHVSRRSVYLTECLDHLDRRSRQLCDWRYIDELPPRDISTRASMTVDAVVKSLQRIRERLRDCVQRKLLHSRG